MSQQELKAVFAELKDYAKKLAETYNNAAPYRRSRPDAGGAMRTAQKEMFLLVPLLRSLRACLEPSQAEATSPETAVLQYEERRTLLLIFADRVLDRQESDLWSLKLPVVARDLIQPGSKSIRELVCDQRAAKLQQVADRKKLEKEFLASMSPAQLAQLCALANPGRFVSIQIPKELFSQK